jgi:hypothetical protein
MPFRKGAEFGFVISRLKTSDCSATATLFRLYPDASGSIEIDHAALRASICFSDIYMGGVRTVPGSVGTGSAKRVLFLLLLENAFTVS